MIKWRQNQKLLSPSTINEILMHLKDMKVKIALADLGFPRVGGNAKDGGANLIFWSFVPENCIKMKVIGLRGTSRAERLLIRNCISSKTKRHF